MRWGRLAGLGLITLTGSLAGFSQGKPNADTSGSAASNLFNRECAGCHAEDGHGFQNLPGIPDFRDASFQKAWTDDQFADSIVNGNGLMPTFKLVLKPDQVRNLVAYIRTLPVSPPAAQQERTSCASCHGDVPPGSFVEGEKQSKKPWVANARTINGIAALRQGRRTPQRIGQEVRDGS